MTVGNAAAHANSELNVWRGTNYTGWTSIQIGLHTGDPGAAGTANASVETTKQTVTMNAPSGGSMSLASSVSWTSWPVGANGESISHISIWDNGTTFKRSAALSAAKTMATGDTLTLSTLTVAKTPIAA